MQDETRIMALGHMIHIKTDDVWLQFAVYPLIEWRRTLDSETNFSYIDKENEPDTVDVFEEGKCFKKFEGSFCWRGVWEGRIYFTDEEYWGEDLTVMTELYNEHIVPWCKDFIKKRDPHGYYD